MRKRYSTVLSLIIWQSSIFILLLTHLIGFPQFFALGLLAQLYVASLWSPGFCEPGYLRFVRYFNILGILVFFYLIVGMSLAIIQVDWPLVQLLEQPVVNIPTLGILIILAGLATFTIGEGISSRDLRIFMSSFGVGPSYDIDPGRSVYFTWSPDRSRIVQYIPVLAPPPDSAMRTELIALSDESGLWIRRISKGHSFLRFLSDSFNFRWPSTGEEAFRAIEEIYRDVLEVDDRFDIRADGVRIIAGFHVWPRLSDFATVRKASLPGNAGIDDLLIHYLAAILVIGFRQVIRVDRIDIDQDNQVFGIQFSRADAAPGKKPA